LPSWQLPFVSQQPPAQLFASQTHAPATHSWPAAQATHAAPPAPHIVFAVPGSQVVPLQHPALQSPGAQKAVQL